MFSRLPFPVWALCTSDLHLFRSGAMDVIGAAASSAAPETRVRRPRTALEKDQELHGWAAPWRMRRLITIWNSLPGVRPVEKFETTQLRSPGSSERYSRKLSGTVRLRGALVPERLDEPGLHSARDRRRPKCALYCIVPKAPHSMRSEPRQSGKRIRCANLISRTLRKQGRRVQSFRKEGERVYRLKP
jgi:hypothetical protein